MDREKPGENTHPSCTAKKSNWYAPHLENSLRMIEAAELPKDARIIDVGGGDSPLYDVLLDEGYRDLTVLDISAAKLENIKRTLGSKSGL